MSKVGCMTTPQVMPHRGGWKRRAVLRKRRLRAFHGAEAALRLCPARSFFRERGQCAQNCPAHCFPTGAEKRKCFSARRGDDFPPGEHSPGGNGRKHGSGESMPGMVISPCAWRRAPVPWWRLWTFWPFFRRLQVFPARGRALPEWLRGVHAGARGSSAGSS